MYAMHGHNYLVSLVRQPDDLAYQRYIARSCSSGTRATIGSREGIRGWILDIMVCRVWVGFGGWVSLQGLGLGLGGMVIRLQGLGLGGRVSVWYG